MPVAPRATHADELLLDLTLAVGEFHVLLFLFG